MIIQGTSDGVNWLPYEFPCKPGNVSRRPCTIAPYHYRMDWKMYVCVLFLATNVRCLLALLFGRVAIAWLVTSGAGALCLHCLHQVVCSNDGTTL